MRAVTLMLCLLAGPVVLATSCSRPAHVPPDPRVGAVFRNGANRHVCTGSVLHSTNGDLVLTAAHCLIGDGAATFVPGFADDARLADIWTVDSIYLDTRWISNRDPRADYAIARVSGTGDKTLERRAGAALTLGTAPTPGTRVSVTGYAAGVGGRPIGCQGSTEVTKSGFPAVVCAGLVGGTSGSPWVSGSTVVGLVGGLDGGGCTENLSYSAPFDQRTAELLTRAEAGGPGDTPPADYSDNC